MVRLRCPFAPLVWRGHIKDIVTNIKLKVGSWVDRFGTRSSVIPWRRHNSRRLSLRLHLELGLRRWRLNLGLRRLLHLRGRFIRAGLLRRRVPSTAGRWLRWSGVALLVMTTLAAEWTVAEECTLLLLYLSVSVYSWKCNTVGWLRWRVLRANWLLAGGGRWVGKVTLRVTTGRPVSAVCSRTALRGRSSAAEHGHPISRIGVVRYGRNFTMLVRVIIRGQLATTTKIQRSWLLCWLLRGNRGFSARLDGRLAVRDLAHKFGRLRIMVRVECRRLGRRTAECRVDRTLELRDGVPFFLSRRL